MITPSFCCCLRLLLSGLVRLEFLVRYMVAVFETKTYVSMLTEILAGGIDVSIKGAEPSSGELWSALRKLPVMLPREAGVADRLWVSLRCLAAFDSKRSCTKREPWQTKSSVPVSEAVGRACDTL